MIASHKGQLDAVMALIETGAEVSQTNIVGSYTRVIMTLIGAETEVNCTDKAVTKYM